jgi:hypothetical protein
MDKSLKINQIKTLRAVYTKMGVLLVAFIWKTTGQGD